MEAIIKNDMLSWSITVEVQAGVNIVGSGPLRVVSVYLMSAKQCRMHHICIELSTHPVL